MRRYANANNRTPGHIIVREGYESSRRQEDEKDITSKWKRRSVSAAGEQRPDQRSDAIWNNPLSVKSDKEKRNMTLAYPKKETFTLAYQMNGNLVRTNPSLCSISGYGSGCAAQSLRRDHFACFLPNKQNRKKKAPKPCARFQWETATSIMMGEHEGCIQYLEWANISSAWSPLRKYADFNWFWWTKVILIVDPSF